jgi:hypothetical protein
MYAAFNLSINEQLNYTLIDSGNKIFRDNQRMISDEINKYIDEDGSIKASEMQYDWFPEVKTDVFISHSSKDRELAIMLAGWLKDKMGLSSFIDSCVWGYCDKLLNMIDGRYCYLPKSKTYNYQKRNYSTSHVHNMLSISLSTMLDRCESVFFLNTDNSIKKSKDDLFTITESPWIYYELSTIKTIRRIVPQYLLELQKTKIEKRTYMYHEVCNAFPTFNYNVDLSSLYDITWDDLLKWELVPDNVRLSGLYDRVISREVSLNG